MGKNLIDKFPHELAVGTGKDFVSSYDRELSKKSKPHTDFMRAVFLYAAQREYGDTKNSREFFNLLRVEHNAYYHFISGDSVYLTDPLTNRTFNGFNTFYRCLEPLALAGFNNPGCYLVSSTLCKVLDSVKYKSELSDVVFSYLKSDSLVCFRFSQFKTDHLRNIHSYAFFENNLLTITMFAELAKYKLYVAGYIDIDRSKGIDDCVFESMLPDIAVEEFGKDTGIALGYRKIIHLTLNTLLYMNSPGKHSIINKKISEFSAKKSKRHYEINHYSKSDYTTLAIDPEVTRLRAYEQGKSWYRCPHTRWQRCGTGNKDVKLIFLAPQHPKRRKLF